MYIHTVDQVITATRWGKSVWANEQRFEAMTHFRKLISASTLRQAYLGFASFT